MSDLLDLAVDTPRGLVDLVAVDRVLAGIPTQLTPAERSYALTQLARSLVEKPAETGGGKWDRHDTRILNASIGFGTTPQLLRDRIQTHKDRHGLELPAAWSGHCDTAARPLPPDCPRCGSKMPEGRLRSHGCRVCKTRRARERRREQRG